MFWFVLGVTIVVLIAITVLGVRHERTKLVRAPKGSVRVVTKGTRWADETVEQYAGFGWKLVRQTKAKSRGRRSQVTMTFRKK